MFGWNISDTNLTRGAVAGYASENVNRKEKIPPSHGESCGPQIVADQTNRLSSECGDAEQPCSCSLVRMDKRTTTASDVFGKERSLSLSRARERPKNQRKDNQISTHAFVFLQKTFLPRAARRVSTADRIADVNTPTRCSDSSRAMSFSPTRSLVLVSMSSSSSSSLPVARSFFFLSLTTGSFERFCVRHR